MMSPWKALSLVILICGSLEEEIHKPQEGKRDIYIKYIHHKGKGWTNMNTGRKKGHTLT